MNHCIECPEPVYCRERCRRHYNRMRMRRLRARYPMGTCTACHRNRPIQRKREGWCESCVTRWKRDGRPESGPPPLNPEAVAAARRAGAEQARAIRKLNQAIREGGWEWVA